jgi:hypothetical protein
MIAIVILLTFTTIGGAIIGSAAKTDKSRKAVWGSMLGGALASDLISILILRMPNGLYFFSPLSFGSAAIVGGTLGYHLGKGNTPPAIWGRITIGALATGFINFIALKSLGLF